MNMTDITLFEETQVRRVWDKEKEEWYYSVVDVVKILSESVDPRNYWKVLKNRLKTEGSEVVTFCNQLKMLASDGKYYLTDAANTETVLRILQSIPSPRAEPFKQWLATLGNDRIDEINNPELGIQRAKERAIQIWKRQGHDDNRINKRLHSINTRNAFTDLLKDRGIKEGFEYALITNKVYTHGLGVPGGASEYRSIKGIKKNDNLRDHMNNLEIALVDLAEIGSQHIIQEKDSKNFEEIQDAVTIGSEIAGNARKNIEKEIGKSIVSKKNYLTVKKKNFK